MFQLPDPAANDEGPRRSDIHDVQARRQLLREDRGTKGPVSSYVDTPEKDHERHLTGLDVRACAGRFSGAPLQEGPEVLHAPDAVIQNGLVDIPARERATVLGMLPALRFDHRDGLTIRRGEAAFDATTVG